MPFFFLFVQTYSKWMHDSMHNVWKKKHLGHWCVCMFTCVCNPSGTIRLCSRSCTHQKQAQEHMQLMKIRLILRKCTHKYAKGSKKSPSCITQFVMDAHPMDVSTHTQRLKKAYQQCTRTASCSWCRSCLRPRSWNVTCTADTWCTESSTRGRRGRSPSHRPRCRTTNMPRFRI